LAQSEEYGPQRAPKGDAGWEKGHEAGDGELGHNVAPEDALEAQDGNQNEMPYACLTKTAEAADTTLAGPAPSGPLLLLGADPAATNFGVAALAHGAIATWLESRPGEAVALLEYEPQPIVVSITRAGRRLDLPLINMRFSWRLYLSNNILRLLWTALWTRALPRSWRDAVRRRQPCLRAIQEADTIAAISGGDSFSDIYGLGRFFYAVLPQVLILWMGRPLVLLPQTYGPYRSRLARGLGGYVLRHASRVYSRDRAGMEVVRDLAGERNGAVRFAHDLGFALEPEPPSAARVEWLERLKTSGPLVGLNVSGLLYCGGYTRANMFNLKTDYAELVQKLLRQLLAQEPVSVILVPHVFGSGMENDPEACRKVHEQLPAELRARVHTVEGRWSAGEIKHLIGRCDFFIGSRMHACIAALSQGVPAAGLAYSRKFAGVFETVDVADLVFDLAELPGEEVVKGVTRAFEMRQSYAARLQAKLPEVRENQRTLFAKGA